MTDGQLLYCTLVCECVSLTMYNMCVYVDMCVFLCMYVCMCVCVCVCVFLCVIYVNLCMFLLGGDYGH